MSIERAFLIAMAVMMLVVGGLISYVINVTLPIGGLS